MYEKKESESSVFLSFKPEKVEIWGPCGGENELSSIPAKTPPCFVNASNDNSGSPSELLWIGRFNSTCNWIGLRHGIGMDKFQYNGVGS